MPINQMKFVLKLLDSSDKTGFADGKSEGAVVKVLYKKGYVTPGGKFGRKIKWELNTSCFNEAEFLLMRNLVEKAKNN